MSTAELKLSIANLLGSTKNSKLLDVIYEILLSEKQEKGFQLSATMEKDLQRRIAKHKSGKSKSYSWEEVKRNIKSK
jgi:putative addiction module component (TIGR02574 family)